MTIKCEDYNTFKPGSLSYTNNGLGGCLISGSVTGTITGTYNPCGGNIYQVWTFADDCGRISTITQTITVTDNTPPVITVLPGQITVECPLTPGSTTPVVTDNCDPTPTLTFTDILAFNNHFKTLQLFKHLTNISSFCRYFRVL